MPQSKYKIKKIRQQKIREIIETKEIATQEQLVAELLKQNISVTQATLSRDLREIGVVKMIKGLGEYVYKIADEVSTSKKELKNKFLNFVKEINDTGNLILVKTPPGEAQGVARVIDLAEIEHILGTVAGDDTILVVIDSADNAKKVKKIFQDLLLRTKS
jgi:transcriptional regulator of arginine metabolism|uniref:Arginine repressor n=1 Tax=candidate division WOR-3 bacterium TaxID=2052148 RepID=A0A7V3RI24_UNCW3